MERLLRCDCGFEVRADDDVEFVVAVQRHALEAHGMRFTPDQVRRLALRLEPGDATGQPPRGDTEGGKK